MKRSKLFLFLLFIVIIAISICYAIIRSSYSNETLIISHCVLKHNDLVDEKDTLIIDKIIDLNGECLSLTCKCIWFKEKGKIINGTILGNNTSIIAPNSVIFDNVSFGGTWVVPDINVAWIKIDHNNCIDQIQSIMKLQNDSVFNIIRIPIDTLKWRPNANTPNLIELSSNSHLFCSGVIKTLSSDIPHYEVINIEGKHDVIVTGGVFVGDVKDHLYGNRSSHEWGFGIQIYNSDRIVIEGCEVSFFTGDGIYLGGGKESIKGANENGCHNIEIKGVQSSYNRRQGISVTSSIDNLSIKGCTISHTGFINGTLPSAGIDFELNDHFQRLQHIVVTDCSIINNKRGIWLIGYENNDDIKFERVSIKQKVDCDENGIEDYNVYHGILLMGDFDHLSFVNCDLSTIVCTASLNHNLSPISIQNSTLYCIYNYTMNDNTERKINIENSKIDISNKSFYDQGLEDNKKRKTVSSIFYCGSPLHISLDNCSFSYNNTKVQSCFYEADCDATINLRNMVIDHPCVFPNFNASFNNCRIVLDEQVWFGVRRGQEYDWSCNSFFSTSLPSLIKIGIIRGPKSRNEPVIKYSNNIMLGKIKQVFDMTSVENHKVLMKTEN